MNKSFYSDIPSFLRENKINTKDGNMYTAKIWLFIKTCTIGLSKRASESRDHSVQNNT